MNDLPVQQAVELAGQVGHVLLATADAMGRPHVAAAGRIDLARGDRLVVRAWFCPATVVNLQQNARISLVVWQSREDRGLQLIGHVEEMEDIEVLDGYEPAMDESGHLPPPQVERRLVVAVGSVLAFSLAPHSDEKL
jgi:hypothetical protein